MDNPETHVSLNTQDTRHRTKTWIIQRHMYHLTHKTQDKDMDNPETHVSLNTQDTGQIHG